MAKKIKRRADSYFGIHFDFHANNATPSVGHNTTEAMVEEVIEKIRPDYIQTDCKGHPGNSSYPTKVGNRVAGLVTDRDTMQIWRSATAKHGVGLYMHYSGVWDTQAVEQHPDWAVTNANGERDTKGITSVFGPYADELLIPQLIELGGEYGVDGVWVDGECWATLPDYTPEIITRFKKETGVRFDKPPENPGDPFYYEFMQWHREAFRKYLRYYIDKVHKVCPDFQIASNWAFSSFMPEPVSAPVDYITGDYTPINSVNMARYEARCMSNQGVAWDLLAWGFLGTYGGSIKIADRTTKTGIQLSLEAASAIAMGGAFCVYLPQHRDGSVKMWEMDPLAEAAKFCRDREEVCFQSTEVPQVGILSNGYDYYKRSQKVLSHDSDVTKSLMGAINLLLDAQYCVDVVLEKQDFERYPVLVVPNNKYFDDETAKRLRAYVKNGGKLVLGGVDSVKCFEDMVEADFCRNILPMEHRYIEYDGVVSAAEAKWREALPRKGAKAFGHINEVNDRLRCPFPAATVNKYGKGAVCALHIDILDIYVDIVKAATRDFMTALMEELFPEKLVRIDGTHLVDVIAREKAGKLNIHIINMSKRDVVPMVYDEIVPLRDITVHVKLDKKPASVTVVPSGAEPDWSYDKGALHVTLPKLEIYDIISIEPAK
ncbi:MAG: beta-galactosidase trimerization domain-containing protein [Oscillospiraceae bacterium]|nr:beta-galactosidase trimerization domain-containing protein [Oscillospiraceae bacterium]